MSEINAILDRSEDMLAAAQSGLKQFENSEGQARLIGLYNAITFGRSVTFVLKNLKGKTEGFDDWYSSKVDFLIDDSICSYMNELRSKILKEGDPDTASYANLDNFNTNQLARATPPWADGSFIGDRFGGSGFYVKRQDGTELKFYYDFDFDNVETGLYFKETQDPDKSEFNQNIVPAEEDLKYYIGVMAVIAREANDKFRVDE